MFTKNKCEEFIMTDGEKIRAKREERGLTVEELSALSDLSVRVVKMIEKGTRPLYTSDLQKLCPVLDMGLDYFFELDDPEEDGK
ncbi:MAG: helix-turn-helix domain-containing protein [Bacteroidales bacterium]|nr:helix-turn-helix domain-containing protein [Bacteroidales bacterium]